MISNNKWINYLCEQQDPEDDTDYGSEESPFNHNAEILEQHFALQEFDLESADILDQIKLGKLLGKGAFGKVFEIEDSTRAIKFFKHSFNMTRDIERVEKISNDVYSGKASLKDFHVFDHGKLGKSGLYYIIMPKIIPVEKTQFYKSSDIFADVLDDNKLAANFFNGRSVQFEEWASFLFTSLRKRVRWGDGKRIYQEEEINLYSKTLFSLMRAGYRAYMEFGGLDLHSGNIGYYVQRPDVFFYFDM